MDILVLSIIGVFGLIIGSFLNMLSDRLPRNEQIFMGRSHCDYCLKALHILDLIPIFSWIMLRGVCRYCHKPIPYRNTLVEVVTASVFIATYVLMGPYTASFSDSMLLVLHLMVGACLIAIFVIDLEHMIIPDVLLLVILIATIGIYALDPTVRNPMEGILSGAGAGLFFLMLVLITKGRGMGMGDVKYAAVIGFLLRFPDTLYALYFAFLTGAFLSVILILRHKKRFGQTIPFGPFLVAGTLLAHLRLLAPIGVIIFPFLA